MWEIEPKPGREWTVDSNLTAIHQSPNCVTSSKKKKVAPTVHGAALINIHSRKSFLLI